jgi:hypothetical protein
MLCWFSFLTVLSPVIVSANNVHVYTVDTPELKVYQGNVPLTQQQKHIALIYVADQMQQGSVYDLIDFAKIALKEMAFSFEDEADKSNNEILDNPDDRKKLYRWTHSTLEYAKYLHLVSDSINELTPIEMNTDSSGELLIIVDNQPFFIISPSLHEPEMLDQEIINAVCQTRDCQLELIGFKEEPDTKTIVIEANWQLTDRSRPEYVTVDGLHFIFNDIKNRSDKQNACLKIIKELKLVSDLLTQAYEDGLYIDWEHINVLQVGDKKRYKLVMNRAGESILIEAVELAKLPELTVLVSPWLKAKVYKKKYHQYIEADILLAGIIN